MSKFWLRMVALLPLLVIMIGITSPAIAGKPKAYDPSACASDTKGKPLSQACTEMIEAFPKPEVEAIDQDKFTLSAYSFWRVGPDAVNLYDSPNGSVVGQIAKGFNFVNAINLDTEGWLQIQ